MRARLEPSHALTKRMAYSKHVHLTKLLPVEFKFNYIQFANDRLVIIRDNDIYCTQVTIKLLINKTNQHGH